MYNVSINLMMGFFSGEFNFTCYKVRAVTIYYLRTGKSIPGRCFLLFLSTDIISAVTFHNTIFLFMRT